MKAAGGDQPLSLSRAVGAALALKLPPLYALCGLVVKRRASDGSGAYQDMDQLVEQISLGCPTSKIAILYARN